MIRLVNIDDIDLHYDAFNYYLKRKYMTEKERMKDDESVNRMYAIFIKMRYEFIRNKRNELLAKTDYYFMPDILISDNSFFVPNKIILYPI